MCKGRKNFLECCEEEKKKLMDFLRFVPILGWLFFVLDVTRGREIAGFRYLGSVFLCWMLLGGRWEYRLFREIGGFIYLGGYFLRWMLLRGFS